MKVTVTFGKVRVIVPCGNGDLSVRDLMELAVTRYKKATGKPSNYWVTIHNLQISKDDGILYPDDHLTDVADDREQITAIFEEQCSYLPLHNGGDGTSASSIGTGSPELFHSRRDSHSPQYSNNDVEITEDCVPNGLIPLHVRRGSEPALNSPSSNSKDLSKRWSTVVIVNNGHAKHSNNSQEESSSDSDIPGEREAGNGEETSQHRHFSRSPGRLSVARNNLELYHWQDRCGRQQERKEPLGGSASSSDRQTPDRDESDSDEEKEMIIILKKDNGPLGIHVIPNYDTNGRDRGLIIQGIEQGGRIYEDGRISVGDCIMEINGHRLHHVNFQKAQEIFKQALDANEIRLSLLKGLPIFSSKFSEKIPPPLHPKPSPNVNISCENLKENKEEFLTPSNKSRLHTINTLTSNTRKIGRKIHIQLKKGCYGLGFSVTTRDNPAGKSCPIYIKNILTKGSAIEDGKLKPGDRLLEVNGMEITGKSQDDVVTMLRGIPQNEIVDLLVSRQISDPCSPSPSLPRELPPDKAGEEQSCLSGKHREVLTFEIPLNDTGSAGLGVSVKGKTSATASNPTDLGIYVKSVIHGGAASKDGRLRPNDQLVNINGTLLLGMTNSQAMETLRRAMTHGDGPNPNAIILTITRRVPSNEDLDNLRTGSHHRSDSIISGSGESDGSATILGGNIRICDTQSNVFPETKTPETISTFPITKEVPRKFSLPNRHPVIDFLMGQTPKSDVNISDCDSLILPDSCASTPIRKSGRRKSNKSPNSEKQSIPASDFSPCLSNKNSRGEIFRVPESNRKNSDGSESRQSLNEDPSFSRDGFGRQSMSEKRHAHLDAKSTDTYQRNKKAKEERDKWRARMMNESLCFSDEQIRDKRKWTEDRTNNNSGSSFGMRKSCSLESLQTVLQELKKESSANLMPNHSSSTIKGRGCNDSFRVAVDRSYEMMYKESMQKLDENNVPERRMEVELLQPSSNITNEDLSSPYRNKINNSKRKKILKGLGSMFRFGKNSKSDLSKKNSQEELKHEAERLRAKWAAQEEHERIQEHYKRFIDEQRQIASQTYSSPVLPSTPSHNISSPHHRQRLQFLRSRYQVYHDDEHDDWNEQETKEILVRQPSLPLFLHRRYPINWQRQSPEIQCAQAQQSQIRRSQSLRYTGRKQVNKDSISHSQRTKTDICKEMERAGSRTGISDPKIYERYMSCINPSSSPVNPVKNMSPHGSISKSSLTESKRKDFITRSPHRTTPKTTTSLSSDELDCQPFPIASAYKSDKFSGAHSKASLSSDELDSTRSAYNSPKLKASIQYQLQSKYPSSPKYPSKRQNHGTGSKV